jgi:excisionase family DNA binding protein
VNATTSEAALSLRDTGRKYLTKQETAALLGVTVRTIERWMQNHVLPYYRIGGGHVVRFDESLIRQHLDENYKVALQ